MISDLNRYSDAVRNWIWIEAANALRIFGDASAAGLLPLSEQDADDAASRSLIEKTPGWHQFINLHAYACLGQEGEDGSPLKNEFFDQFLSSKLDLLRLPETVLDVLALAQARQILDGGTREITVTREEADIPHGYLSFAEIAALADMDERSVRNATNHKLPDPLATESFGKRTFIAVTEARRWLTGRKGFRATSRPESAQQPTRVLNITGPLAKRLQQAAASRQVAIETYLSHLLDTEDPS